MTKDVKSQCSIQCHSTEKEKMEINRIKKKKKTRNRRKDIISRTKVRLYLPSKAITINNNEKCRSRRVSSEQNEKMKNNNNGQKMQRNHKIIYVLLSCVPSTSTSTLSFFIIGSSIYESYLTSKTSCIATRERRKSNDSDVDDIDLSGDFSFDDAHVAARIQSTECNNNNKNEWDAIYGENSIKSYLFYCISFSFSSGNGIDGISERI